MRTYQAGLDTAFWTGRRVLVTGHTGFKGSWLSSWLVRLGAEVTGYALAPVGSPNLFELLGLESRLNHHVADILDLDGMVGVILEARPEIVIHLAAQPLVRESYQDPVATYATNVMGTVNLLEAVRRSQGPRVVVIVTTDKCTRIASGHGGTEKLTRWADTTHTAPVRHARSS